MVVSVTSDAAANAAFNAASQWPTRSGSSPVNNLFGSLVDQNAPNHDSLAASQPPPPPPPSSPPADAPTANTAANDAPPAVNNNNDTSPPGTGTPSANADNAANSNGGTNGAAASSTAQSSATPAPARHGTSKSGDAQNNASATTPDATATDTTTLAQQAAINTAPTPVAVAVPNAAPPVNVPTTTAAPPSGGSTAPLAIAAAAIAATAQTLSPQPALPVTGNSASNTTGTTTTAAAPTNGGAPPKATAPVVPQTNLNGAPAVDVAALTTTVAATAAVGTKASSGKSPAGTATTDDATANSASTDPDVTAAATNGQNAATLQGLSANKAETASFQTTADTASPSTSAAASKEHSPAAGAAPALANSIDPSAQNIGALQPQLNSISGTVSTGNLTATAATGGPVPLSGLAVEIAANVKSGKSSFDIRLDPADLGRIDVRVQIDQNGQVTSHLTVEKPETLSLLQQDAPQLQQALNDAGLKTSGGGLQFSLRDQSSSGQNSGNQSNPNAQRLIVSDEDNVAAAAAGRSYGRSLGSSSGVDIRV